MCNPDDHDRRPSRGMGCAATSSMGMQVDISLGAGGIKVWMCIPWGGHAGNDGPNELRRRARDTATRARVHGRHAHALVASSTAASQAPGSTRRSAGACRRCHQTHRVAARPATHGCVGVGKAGLWVFGEKFRNLMFICAACNEHHNVCPHFLEHTLRLAFLAACPWGFLSVPVASCEHTHTCTYLCRGDGRSISWARLVPERA
eukprot:365080-Chlamydomonas_euryale.AAC.6